MSTKFYPRAWNTVDHSIHINFEGSCMQGGVFKGESNSEICLKVEFHIAATISSLIQSPWITHSFNKHLLSVCHIPVGRKMQWLKQGSCPHKTYILVEKTDKKSMKKFIICQEVMMYNNHSFISCRFTYDFIQITELI